MISFVAVRVHKIGRDRLKLNSIIYNGKKLANAAQGRNE